MELETHVATESPWIQLDKAEAVNRQRRTADVVQGFFKDEVGIEKVISSLDHLQFTNGREAASKTIPFEVRTSIVDALTAAQYLDAESLFSRKIEAFQHAHGKSGKEASDVKKSVLTKDEEAKLAQMAPEYQEWCALSEDERGLRHNSAEAALFKFLALSAHVQDDTSLFRDSLGIDSYTEMGTRLTIESQLQNWLRLDSHDKISQGHAELLESLGTAVTNIVEDPRSFSLDIKLGMVDLFFALKSAQASFEALTRPAELPKFREHMRKAEVAGEKYLLAEQAAA